MAGEPETLDNDEPLVRKVRRHNYDRLLMLSDGVFAIAITLLVLDVRPPKQWDGNLIHLLQYASRALFGYMFGFLAVSGFWIAHRGMFARIRKVDGPATGLSLALLLFVGSVPAAAALVSEHGPSKGIPAYLLLVATIAAVQVALWSYSAFVGDLVDRRISMRDRLVRATMLLIPFVAFVFLFAMGPQALSTWATVPVLLIAVGAKLLRRQLDERRLTVAYQDSM